MPYCLPFSKNLLTTALSCDRILPNPNLTVFVWLFCEAVFAAGGAADLNSAFASLFGRRFRCF